MNGVAVSRPVASGREPGEGIKLEFKLHLGRGPRGQRQVRSGEAPPKPVVVAGRVPRVARLMALAIRFEELVRRGEVADYAELARLGHVTRARMTQIMGLLNVAPDIQEQILFLPVTTEGHDPISERDLRPIAAAVDWREQKSAWGKLSQYRGMH